MDDLLKGLGLMQAAEERVLNFLQQQNRPYNAQGVTDHLAQYGVKKTQAQKALDTLSEANKIICKVITSLQICLCLEPKIQRRLQCTHIPLSCAQCCI
jgi:26S proteasome regulatory subunit (ATPase 3-interacting protein)